MAKILVAIFSCFVLNSFSNGQSISTEFCGTARKGCLRNPPDCHYTAKNPGCTQLITWETYPYDENAVFIKMYTNTSMYWHPDKGEYDFKTIDYIALGLADAPDNIMVRKPVFHLE